MTFEVKSALLSGKTPTMGHQHNNSLERASRRLKTPPKGDKIPLLALECVDG